jgi:hypothetical protein
VNPLFVTLEAAAFLERQYRELALDPASESLRLGVALPRGVVIKPDRWTRSDTVIRHAGLPLLTMDEDVAHTLEDAVLDAENGALTLIEGKATCEGRGCVEFMLDEWARNRQR